MKETFYEQHFVNGILRGCYPVNLSLMAFVHKDYPKDDDVKKVNELPIRAIYYVPKKLKLGDYGTTFWPHSIEHLYINDDGKSWVVSDNHFDISEIDHNTDWYPIPHNEKGHLAKGMVNIDGTVYAYGMVRSVFKRTGVKQWENITTKKKHPNLYADVEASKARLVGSWVGFSAMDGFSGTDIYAGGNRGDCWHYDGNRWDRVDLPVNTDISAITCAPDGLVYISSRYGSVLAGRDDRWKVIHREKEVSHSAWFNGSMYFVGGQSGGSIYTYLEGNDTLTKAEFKTDLPKYMRLNIVGLASCDECLVVYTQVQAYAYDGEIWHEIIELPALSKHT